MISVSVSSVTSYPGVARAMVTAGIDDDAVDAIIADAVAQALIIAPELSDADDTFARGAESIIRPAVARWIIRSSLGGGGRQRTATAGSFSINESAAEAVSFFELSEERKLAAIAAQIEAHVSGTVAVVEAAAPRYIWV